MRRLKGWSKWWQKLCSPGKLEKSNQQSNGFNDRCHALALGTRAREEREDLTRRLALVIIKLVLQKFSRRIDGMVTRNN